MEAWFASDGTLTQVYVLYRSVLGGTGRPCRATTSWIGGSCRMSEGIGASEDEGVQDADEPSGIQDHEHGLGVGSSVQSLSTGTTPACPAPCGAYDAGGKSEIRAVRADTGPRSRRHGEAGHDRGLGALGVSSGSAAQLAVLTRRVSTAGTRTVRMERGLMMQWRRAWHTTSSTLVHPVRSWALLTLTVPANLHAAASRCVLAPIGTQEPRDRPTLSITSALRQEIRRAFLSSTIQCRILLTGVPQVAETTNKRIKGS